MKNLLERLRDAQALAKLVGEAPTFLHAIQSLPSVAKSEATALITGETGTGKELVARAVHYLSARAAFPFVPVNCGSFPETLLEDELFGHERGAFTDAHSARCGLIAQADKGTLFLDEIETLSAKAQVTLLRVLQEKRFRPLGASNEQAVDVRIVAATNAPLNELVQAGTFRADLYYRLRVFFINLPPLRDRKEDIVPLTHHFLKKHTQPGHETPELAPAVHEALLSYDWPGNIRELENAVLRGIHLCHDGRIEIEDLGIPAQRQTVISVVSLEGGTFKTEKHRVIEAFEKDYLHRLMSEYNGNVTQAAVAAGKERRDLGKLLKKYQIDPKHYHSSSPAASRQHPPFLDSEKVFPSF